MCFKNTYISSVLLDCNWLELLFNRISKLYIHDIEKSVNGYSCRLVELNIETAN